jgi:hypothetical protein
MNGQVNVSEGANQRTILHKNECSTPKPEIIRELDELQLSLKRHDELCSLLCSKLQQVLSQERPIRETEPEPPQATGLGYDLACARQKIVNCSNYLQSIYERIEL